MATTTLWMLKSSSHRASSPCPHILVLLITHSVSNTHYSFVVSQSLPSLKDGNNRTVVAEVFLAMFNCNVLPVRPHILVVKDVVHSCSIPAEILTKGPLYLSVSIFIFIFIFIFFYLFFIILGRRIGGDY